METILILVGVIIVGFIIFLIFLAISDKKRAPEIEKRNQQLRAERYAKTLNQNNVTLEEISKKNR